MPKETKDNIKETFEDSISIKADIINRRIYEVLIEAGRIQESHITADHAILLYVEDSLLEHGWLNKI